LKKLILIIPILFFIGCAQPGSPSGGPVDEFPPEVISAVPENYKTSFEDRSIEIEFDEFVTLKSPAQNIIITPPLTKDPEFKLKGKTLNIEFNTILDTNTTYVINFGNSIQDLNEGNVLEDYKYIFSTGDYLDSLVVRGSLRDAYKNEVPENIRVHLYAFREGEDSIPALELPQYFGSVKEDGTFLITNMKPGKYRVFALADANSNYLYDQPNEMIGFSAPIQLRDTAEVQISAFLPTPDIKVTRFRHEGYGVLKAALNRPIDTVQLSAQDSFSFVSLLGSNRDTAYFYFSPTQRDTLDVVLASGDYVDTSTIRFKTFPKPQLRVQKTNISGGFVAPGDSLLFLVNYPIESIDTSLVHVYEDSTEISFQSSIQNRNLTLKFEKTYDQTYRIVVQDSALIGINEIYNDSLGFTAKTKKEIDLGVFILNFTPPDSSSYIIQLVDSKGGIVAEERINQRGTQRIHWIDLNPEKLTLRAIRDVNDDGQWTTGSYWQNLQPEPVYYFSESIEIKPNWEIEFNWSEEQFNF